MHDHLTDQIKSFPVTSGVYLMKDEAEKPIYIGKAKNLRSRVRSYFNKAGSDNRLQIPYDEIDLL